MVVRDHIHLDLIEQAGLVELAPDEVRGERRGVDRHAEIGCEIRDSADMVLMRMRQHDGLELIAALLDEFEIGEHQVDAGILVAREGHPEIDHQPASLTPVQIDVHADLARSAQGEEQQFVFGGHVLLHAERPASMPRPFSVRSEST